MSKYEVAVIERYPDGTKWTHYFTTHEAAVAAIEQLTDAHSGRTYEIRDVAN